jgi:hypothetical protein
MISARKIERFAHGGAVVTRLRNYYGIYQIFDRDGIRYLQHGTTQHGRQYLDGEDRQTPLAYYHPTTPIGQYFLREGTNAVHIGMIGLGTGAIASYMQNEQTLDILELDPDNKLLAEQYFSYLAQGRQQGANISFTFGDGRVQLKQFPDHYFDVLVLDAFNSGSIPIHLLTVEALQLYLQKLQSDGVLLMHLSNRVLNLLPVVYANAMEVGALAYHKSNDEVLHPDAEYTVWMAVGVDSSVMSHLHHRLHWNKGENIPAVRPWTDRFSNLPGAIRWF